MTGSVTNADVAAPQPMTLDRKRDRSPGQFSGIFA